MRRYDLVVFDWDGTLVDSIASIVDCTQHALGEVGVAPVEDSHVRQTIGLGIREMIDKLIPGCDDELFESVCLAYRERWFSAFAADHQPFEGVDGLLTRLAANDYLLGVATAKSRRGLVADFDRTGLGEHFHATRTVDEAPAKPHPGMLESLMEELGTRPERTLMIGDTAHDLEMAANAGTAGLGVLGGSHDRARLSQAPSAAILESVRQLPEWLAAQA